LRDVAEQGNVALYPVPSYLMSCAPRGECLHREEMLWRSGENTKARVVEHPRWRRIPARRDIRTGLLIQPPAGQAQFGAYCPRFFMHNAMRLEQRINIPRGTARVVSQGHRSTAEHVNVRHHATLGEPVTEPTEGLFDALAAE
jgi:hypothetical protein